MATRFRRNAPRRFGPDIIHLSILVFLVAGTITLFTRIETFAYLRAGDAVELPGGERFTVTNIESLTYEDGRPKDYRTAVEHHGGTYTIEVNKPLKISGFSVYQQSFSRSPVAALTDTEGSSYEIGLYEKCRIGRQEYSFTGYSVPERGDRAGYDGAAAAEGEVLKSAEFDAARLYFSVRDLNGESTGGEARFRAGIGGTVGNLTVAAIRMENVAGLKVASDPGYGPVIAASVLLVSGLALTFIQKLKGRRKKETV